MLFFILYGVTGVMPLIAALYLLLRRGNAFAPGVTPPVRLRRWAVAFFTIAALEHVWWLFLYIFSYDTYSEEYMAVVALDCVTLFTTIAGTLLSMLQDRQRPVWPVLAAMISFLALCGVIMVCPSDMLKQAALAYILLLYVIFTVYMVFAVRQYRRWLNENYADLEDKKVWLSQVVTLGFMLLFFIYILVADIFLLFFMHITELILFGLLLWRVETLPQLPAQAQQAPATSTCMDLTQIERLLAEHCVDTKLYLQHDLTLQQLANAIGTNRSYLSQYFSRQGITYNTYINNLRINYFIRSYQEAAADHRPIVAHQLAQESGYRSYSTFSLAFKQRTGQSLTTWIHET